MTTFNQNFKNLVKATLAENQCIKTKMEQKTNDENIQDMDESAKSQDFVQDNKTIGKKYSTTRIKPRNFLSNIAYVGIKKEDYNNKNFILEVYLLLTKNLNPFLLDLKLSDKTKQKMIYRLWKEWMPFKFYRHICKEKNFLYLNGKNEN